MSDEQANAAASGVDELTSDYFPESQPEPQAQEQTGVSQEQVSAEPQQATPASDSAQVAPNQTPAEQKYWYQGKEWTLQELGANPEVARAIFTRAEQTAHYQSQLELSRQAQALLQQQQQLVQSQQKQQQPQQQGSRGPTIDQLKAYYAPHLKAAVDRGELSADFVEAFGAEAVQFVHRSDQLDDARQAIGTLIQRLNAMERASMVGSLENELDQTVASLATQGEHFAQLADPAIRKQFTQYLYEIDFKIGQVRDPRLLARQWFAFNSDAIQAQIAQQAQQAAATTAAKQQTRTLARTDGTGTRPGVAQAQEVPGHLDMISDLYPRLATQR